MYKLGDSAMDATEMVAFDMDGTLIKTKSGKTFPTDENDWVLWDPSVRTVLQRLHAEKKYLAIISNQSGIKENKVTRAAIQRKVDKIIATLGVPMDFICATEDDRFRKPRPGMWEFLCFARNAVKHRAGSVSGGSDSTTTTATTLYEGGAVPVLGLSTYVGDAAGRPKEGTRGKDFADSDYKLALNLAIKVSQMGQHLFSKCVDRSG
jgi:bifunctional polynucleotide phosphatase/kinase